VDRLFLDANILFSAAYRKGAGVAQLWELPHVRLITSDYAVDEARRNLHEPEQRERLDELLASLDLFAATSLDPSLRGDIRLSEKDWPILSGAVHSNATHLITGDLRDFGPFFGQILLGIQVVPPSDYLRSRRKDRDS